MKIRETDIKDIVPYENNPRFNESAVDAVANSIRDFGFKVPIIVDKNNIIIAGHTRLLAAQKLGMDRVPVLMADDLTDEQVKAFRLADNKVGEIATWDDIKLNAELEELMNLGWDMTQFGFNPEDIEIPEPTDDDFDADMEYQKITIPNAHKGDIYQLGDHRLMCGDSTKWEDVEKLIEDKEMDLCVTDPPYNVDIVGGSHALTPEERIAKGYKTIENDRMNTEEFKDFLTKAFNCMYSALKSGGAYYIWHASREQMNFEMALNEAGLQVRQQLIWKKNSLVMGRQDYQWMHEPCLYGWKEGAAHYFADLRTETTILKYNELESMTKEELIAYIESIEEQLATDVISEARPNISIEHPTMKPVALIGRLVKNSSKPGELVVDLFGGSGSTLIACEQLQRKCYMMEYDPKYCDVIIERWEQLTGKKAMKIEEGE